MRPQPAVVAYFSMEIALDPNVPTYSGGLGVLAGDTIRSAADARIPFVAVTLLHRRGYFEQSLDSNGWQTEKDALWPFESVLEEMPQKISVLVEGRVVAVRSWRYYVHGVGGFTVPVYLLDSNLPENSEWDRSLTDHLYGGDARYRLAQEVVLGMAGVKMLRAIGYDSIQRFHMNEGHASLLALELLTEQALKGARRLFNHDDIERVRRQCVFTTHTPVTAGHDQFPMDLVLGVIGCPDLFEMKEVFCCEGVLNMTYLALNLSHYVNGVAKRHGEVSRHLLVPKRPDIHYTIDSITNGIHAGTWVSPAFRQLFDNYIPGWQEDNASLRSALNIPRELIWKSHQAAKQELIEKVNKLTSAGMNSETLTLGFARRATAYKRGDLLFRDLERLRSISKDFGALQILFAGKAHPKDQGGKEIILHIFRAAQALKKEIKLAYLTNYDMALASLLTAGVDVWLNTPQPPLEASGTSGMKAAINGVPSLSVLDGWWIEGCIEDFTGWAIGQRRDASSWEDQSASDAASLYEKLEQAVVPSYYRSRDHFVDVMRHAIAINGSYFNTQRMLQQYVVKAYFS